MRRILCGTCENTSLKGYLSEPGFETRVVRGVAKQPTPDQRKVVKTELGKATVEAMAETGVPIGTRTVQQLDPTHYNCDDCGKKISPGDRAVALSMWREDTGHAQPAWESNFIEGIEQKESGDGSAKQAPN